MDAADEKNRKGSDIPFHPDLAADLRVFLTHRLKAIQETARMQINQPIPLRLPPDMPLFDVPSGLSRILNRDLEVAGIRKRDERNRVVDVHALRTTFGTNLLKGGVPLRTAQLLMRHSKPELTTDVYCDSKALNPSGALTALPSISSARGPVNDVAKAVASGGDTPFAHSGGKAQLAPELAQKTGKRGKSGASADKVASASGVATGESGIVVSACQDKRKTSLTSGVNDVHRKRVMRFEPTTFTKNGVYDSARGARN